MPALALAQPEDPHAMHRTVPFGIAPEVTFPYGFPKSGSYRVFVQMKRAGHVETGAFSVRVEN